MAINKYDEMNELGIDMMREIGSIGGGNAATALSSILNAQVNMELPRVEVLGFNAALKSLGDPEDVVAAIFVELSGEIEGVMLFIADTEFSHAVLARMIGRPGTDFLELDEIDSSALTEIGNIVIASYVTALSTLTNVKVELSVPQFGVNMLGGIMSLPIAMMGQHSDRIMMIKGKFKIGGQALNSHMLLLPDVKSLNVLMKKLGVE